MLSNGFPNMLVIHFIQAGFGPNFSHFLSESTRHVAWLIATCIEEGITSIESTPEAEEEWLQMLWAAAKGFGRYSASCTPSYGNSEGARTMASARNIVHPGNLMHYAAHLERWRDAGDLPGTVTTRASDAPDLTGRAGRHPPTLSSLRLMWRTSAQGSPGSFQP